MNSETIPLLAHASSAAVVAYRSGRAVTAQQFLADAVRLAERLPASRHVLNMCADRYRFTVGLAACLMTERVSLLPSTHTPEVMERLIEFAPDVFCLTDDPACNIALPRVPFPAPEHGDPALPAPADHAALDIPRIPVTQAAAIVFTSGSTGMPVPYTKTWGKLARCVRDGAPRFGLLDGRTHTLIGTVPAQHMYGFESTVLLALLSGNAFNAERPFYPADIAAAVAAVPRPRVLVTTPVHLRALQSAGTQLPPVDLIISATAPLPLELALEAEARPARSPRAARPNRRSGGCGRACGSRPAAIGWSRRAAMSNRRRRCAMSSRSRERRNSCCTAGPRTWSTWRANAVPSAI